jgi:vacuolar protein sorting-associated protein 3
MFLQGSKLYSAEHVQQRIQKHEHRKVLSLELAIVLGKVSVFYIV